ncbi:MAG: EipA family protein, partial [Hyphomicrobiaceae bacterium]
MNIRAMIGVAALLASVATAAATVSRQAMAAEELPWGKTATEPKVITPSTRYDPGVDDGNLDNYDTSSGDYGAGTAGQDTYTKRSRRTGDRYQEDPDYSAYRPAVPQPGYDDDDVDQYNDNTGHRRKAYRRQDPAPGYADPQPQQSPSRFDGTYSVNEIVNAGHNAFGQVARGFAGVVEYAFQKQGRPNGYIIGQEAGGAIVAGLRYGEGILHTKDAGTHTVYWQGPSVGYDFGAEGSKTMILVYDMTS